MASSSSSYQPPPSSVSQAALELDLWMPFLIDRVGRLAKIPPWKLSTVYDFSVYDVLENYSARYAATSLARTKFLRKAKLPPPDFLRVIDCKLSVEQGAVVIVDCPHFDRLYKASETDPGSSSAHGEGYAAISHTFGLYVYDIFNCACAADCRASIARADPARTPCTGMHAYDNEDTGLQQKVIGEVLGMCKLLLDGGVRYAWHDGVCIAQHDEDEVRYFIQHIGWIYAYAEQTVIFLHYIGCPMAPIALPSHRNGSISRWQTRVWTYQEAVLSRRRRYCVRVGHTIPRDSNYAVIESTIASWYEPGGPNCIEILEESDFLGLVMDIMASLMGNLQAARNEQIVKDWIDCMHTWVHLVQSFSFSFPTIAHALESCSSRDSKHEGDRINSVLGLACVHDFVVPKKDRLEEYTMEFFERMGKNGLALALFTINKFVDALDRRQHTWCPTLCSELMLTPSHFGMEGEGPDFLTDNLELKVRSEDGCLEVRGVLACVALHVDIVMNVGGNVEESTGAGVCTQGHENRHLHVKMDYLPSNGEQSNKRHAQGHGVWLIKKRSNPRVHELIGVALRPFFYQHLEKQSQIDRFCADLASQLGDLCRTYYLIFPAEVLERPLDGSVEHDEKLDEVRKSLEWMKHFEKDVKDAQARGELPLDFDAEKELIVQGDLDRLAERTERDWAASRDSRLSIPALLVQGNLQFQPVFKAGCFMMYPALLDVLRQQQYSADYFSFIEELVIM